MGCYREAVGVDDGLHTGLTDAGQQNLVLGIQAEPIGGGEVSNEALGVRRIYEGSVVRGDLDTALGKLHGEFVGPARAEKGEFSVRRGGSVKQNDALAFDKKVRGLVFHGDF